MSAADAIGLLTRPDWQKEAACNGAGPQWFFWEEFTWEQVKDEYYMTEKAFKRARKIDLQKIRGEMEDKYKEQYCAVCPVREECGEYGKYESFGIWGGLNFEERFNAMSEEERVEFFDQKDGAK